MSDRRCQARRRSNELPISQPVRDRFRCPLLNTREALDAIRARDGILPSGQIRRALEDWFQKKGLKVKAPSCPRGKRERKG